MNVAQGVKTVPYARTLFGLSAIFWGVILFMWHDAGAWEDLPIMKLPFGTIVGDVLAIALIAGGLFLLYPRTARAASIVLLAVTLVFVLACVPAIIKYPTTYFTYGSFFEFFSLVCGRSRCTARLERTLRNRRSSHARRAFCSGCARSRSRSRKSSTRRSRPTWSQPGFRQAKCFG